MKIVTLNSEQFDNYAKQHRYRNYFQTSSYANVMSNFGYSTHFLGIINNQNKLIGATLLLYKNYFMGKKIAYAPRGILYNYDNSESVIEMAQLIKKVLSKQGFMLLRIDPYIPLTIRDQNGTIMNFNNKGTSIIENLKNANFIYKGKTLFFETEKPRWEALVLLNKDIREIYEKFDKRIRNKINKSLNSGIEVTIDENKDVTKLYKFLKGDKPLSYYKSIVNNFNENVEIYYAKINPETFVLNSKKTYEKEVMDNEQLAQKIQDMNLTTKERESYLNKKMESDKLLSVYKSNMISSTNLLKENPDGIIIAGALIINYDNAAFLFTEGQNEKYSNLNANYLLKWKLIEDYNNKGFKYLNLDGIVGEFEKENEYSGLNDNKLSFNSTITEYIGEFDLVLNSFYYNLFKKANKKKEK